MRDWRERYLEVDFVDAVVGETTRVSLDRDCSSHFARKLTM